MGSVSLDDVTNLVRRLLTDAAVSVKSVEPIESAGIRCLYNVGISDGNQLQLALTAPKCLPLLVPERSEMRSEQIVLRWLLGLAPDGNKVAVTYRTPNNSTVPPEPPSSQRVLKDFLPVLYNCGQMDTCRQTHYILSQPPDGVLISSLDSPLSSSEQDIVCIETCELLCKISEKVSPTGNFGIAFQVLPSFHSKDFETWSGAFWHIFMSIYKCSGDKNITIPYTRIEKIYYRFQSVLDTVWEPRLVVVDAGEHANTIVFRYSHDKNKVNADGGVNRVKADIEVVGLQSWSYCIFGDPLFATIFQHSIDFKSVSAEKDRNIEDWIVVNPNFQGREIKIDNKAVIRILIYGCYHAVLDITRQYYRRNKDNEREDQAWLKLQQRLDLLEKISKLEDDLEM